ncbi:g1235 [Coccomyxa elongata]
MESHEACVDPASTVEKRGAAHKSRTHRLLGPHKQAEGWNVLALSNGRWKLPDDQFGAFLEHYVADVPRFNLGLVVKKSKYFPYIMDMDKSTTKGESVGSPMEVLRVISFPGGEAALCAAPPWAALSEAQEGAPEPCELSRAVPGDHSGQSHRRAHLGEAVSCVQANVNSIITETEWQEVVVKKREPAWLYHADELDRHIADVMNPETGGVVEVQHSHLCIEEAVERERFYDKMIWIVDGTSPGAVRVAGKNFAVIAAQRSFSGTMTRPVYVDTVSGLYLVKEWHDEHKKLCLGMSVEMEGFFKEHFGRGSEICEAASRYRSRRGPPTNELQLEGVGLEVTGNTYEWRGKLRESGFTWSTEKRRWYFSAQRGREEEVRRHWAKVNYRKFTAERKAESEKLGASREVKAVGEPEWL